MEESDNAEDDEVEEMHLDGVAATLWPTLGVRQRWMDAVCNSLTISEVALALSSLLEHAKAFGVAGPDSQDTDLSSYRNSSSRQWGSSRNSPFKTRRGNDRGVSGSSSTRSKIANKSGGRKSNQISESDWAEDRPRRAAARAVKSYAE